MTEEVEKRRKEGLVKAIEMAKRYTGVTGVVYIRDEKGEERWLPKISYMMMLEAGRKVTLLEEREQIKAETEVSETKVPEGVEVVKYVFFTPTDVDMAATMFDAMGTGKYEFRSAVNLGTMVRCVMYEKGEKTGTPIRVVVQDKDMAWHLQQLIDWVYRRQAKVLAVKKEDKTLNVAFRMEGIKPLPPKEKLWYHFKKTDGWSLIGEEK